MPQSHSYVGSKRADQTREQVAVATDGVQVVKWVKEVEGHKPPVIKEGSHEDLMRSIIVTVILGTIVKCCLFGSF